MVKEYQYISINRILDELLRHPMLNNLTLEQVVSYTLTFIGANGHPKMYQDKIEDIDIHEFRGLLPCDLISIIQVKDLASGTCLRSMTDNFTPGMRPESPHHPHHKHPPYLPPLAHRHGELTFKTQGRVLYTSFQEGKVQLAYKSIPVDEDGFPMIIDNPIYLDALRAFVKQEVFTIKFDMGEIPSAVLQNAQQEYCWRAAQLNREFKLPSVSEMESLARAFNTMIAMPRHFDDGFKHLGDREYLKRQ